MRINRMMPCALNHDTMGNLSSSFRSYFEPPLQQRRLLLLGLDCAGKTTILHKLKPARADVVTTIPTIGFNLETLNLQGTIFVAYDVGGRDPIPHQYVHAKRVGVNRGTDGVIFVVDSQDPGRLPHARDDLHYVIQDEHLKGKPLLIFCNKQDLPNAMPPSEIAKQLGVSEVSSKWHAVGCSAYKKTGLMEGFDWMSNALQDEQTESDSKGDDMTSTLSVQSDESGIELEHDATESGGNLTLQHFSDIKNGTECPFAKSANLWGGSTCPPGSTLEDQALAHVAALTEFVRQSRQGANVDGFCIELDDAMATQGSPKELGDCVRRMLTTMSDHDPAGEQVMRKKYIGNRGWRFRFNKHDFFITTFAPCYPPTCSRYAFGTGRAFLLLQPHASFGRHDLPHDTPDTNWEAPKTVRDKTRVAFRAAGRGYYIPNTTRYPPAEHIVRPIDDDGNSVVRWWEPAA